MQPAQRPTVPQDGVFLNHCMQKSPGAGWRPQPVHTCCPTDWPVEPFPSRDNTVFGVEFSVNSGFACSSGEALGSAAQLAKLKAAGNSRKVRRTRFNQGELGVGPGRT